MPVPQQKIREAVFQLLYSYTFNEPDKIQMISLLMQQLSISKKTANQVRERVELIMQKLPEIDDIITNISTAYSFKRIQSVQKNVLRLGVYELLYDDSIPPTIAIAEAMRISKKFSTPESSTFVNAILDAALKLHQGEAIDQDRIEKSAKLLLEQEEKENQS